MAILMNVICSPRRGGKTTVMITRLRENPDAILLTPTIMQASALRKQYPDVANRIQTAGVHEVKGYSHDTEFLVDNADQILATYIGQWPDAVSISGKAFNIRSNPHINADETE